MSQPSTEPTAVTDPVTDPAGQDPPEPTGTPSATDPPATDPPAEPKPADVFGGVAFEDLPAATQKEIRQLRAEAAGASTKAREQVAAKAREDALAEAATQRQEAIDATKAEIADAVARALGIKKDDAAELTPEQVIEKITAERDAEKTAREENAKAYAELALEVAVQDAAAMHEARPDRLLDSRSFMREVRKLDPKAEGYRAAVADAVEKAVEADADLKAKTKPIPPAVSGGTTVAGSRTKRPEDMTIDELREARNHRRS